LIIACGKARRVAINRTWHNGIAPSAVHHKVPFNRPVAAMSKKLPRVQQALDALISSILN
jgi:lysozyme family protein